MMNINFLLVFVPGLLIGVLIGWLISKLRTGKEKQEAETSYHQSVSEMESALKYEKERSEGLKASLQNINDDLKAEREKVMSVKIAYANLKAKYEALEAKLSGQKEELQAIREQFSSQFKNLANDIFEEKSQKFTAQNKTNIHELLKPLGERIQQFEKKVESTNIASIERNVALREQIKNLSELNKKITSEAKNLTDALKVDKKLQGSWGEIQLESILQSAGLQKDIHYLKEKNLKSDTDENQRPDYIVRLPDDKNVIIDSKVSLVAYAGYIASEDETEQLKFLSDHTNSVKNHIRGLGEKNYQNLHGINQPDYVLMFLANEAALITALQSDPALYETALSRNIVIVTTTTLMATLKTIAYIWKHDLQNRNALEIARQAGTLYDKFVAFSEDLTKLGSQMQTTQNTYNDAV
ncbi:MAG: DNA recombination protein RmuC, partial [Cyclobacteriaceae bacterium]